LKRVHKAIFDFFPLLAARSCWFFSPPFELYEMHLTDCCQFGSGGFLNIDLMTVENAFFSLVLMDC